MTNEPKEQKKFLMFLGVVIIAIALLALRLLTWKWERGNKSFFSLPEGPTADLNSLWQQSKNIFNQQTDILNNQTGASDQNKKIIDNLKSKIEQEINKQQK